MRSVSSMLAAGMNLISGLNRNEPSLYSMTVVASSSPEVTRIVYFLPRLKNAILVYRVLTVKMSSGLSDDIIQDRYVSWVCSCSRLLVRFVLGFHIRPMSPVIVSALIPILSRKLIRLDITSSLSSVTRSGSVERSESVLRMLLTDLSWNMEMTLSCRQFT